MERLKRKKEDEEKQRLNAVFEQYRDEFEEVKLAHINQSFVRGEVVNADKSGDLSLIPPPTAKKPKSIEEAKRLASEIGRKIMLEAQQKKIAMQIQTGTAPTVQTVTADNLPAIRPPKPGSNKDTQKSRMTNLEMFKQELKQMQEMRKERRGLREELKKQYGNDVETIDRLAPSLDNPYLHSGSEYADDPNTTNLYLANMPSDIELQDLYDTFGSFGPLASAKILYPRTDEEHRRGSALSGFVAYMTRIDAERAITVMSGAQIRGYELRVSWAKPIPIPPAPFFVPQSLRELAMPDPPSGLPFNAQPQVSDIRDFLQKYKDLPRLGSSLPTDNPDMTDDYRKMLKNAIVRVVIPTERPLLFLIHRVIEFIIREGPMFEVCIMERERMNPMYRFLFDNNHPTHVYYRWKLYSLLNGEDTATWRIERFRVFEDGSWWEPPPVALYEGGMPTQLYARAYKPMKSTTRHPTTDRSRSGSPQEEEKRTSLLSKVDDTESLRRRGILSSEDRDTFEDMLRDLKPDKTSIGDAMVWCIDHADCAKEIVQCLFESLDIKETPLHKKVARFYLVNDILGNCGVRVRDVFYYRQFIQDYLEKMFVSLNTTLETIESRIKAEHFRQRIMLCFRMWEDNAIYHRDFLIRMQNIFLGLVKPTVSAETETDDEDLDGVPIDDEDIDGVPLTNPTPISVAAKPPSTKPHVPKALPETTSKWNQDTLDNFTSKWDAPELSEPTYSGKDSVSSKRSDRSEADGDNEAINLISSARDEERRRLLREIELKIVQYQDDLEADGAPNVDKKISEYRQKLIERMKKELDEFEKDQTHSSNKKHRDEDHRSSKKHRRSRSRSRDRKHRSRSRSRDKKRRSRSRERRPRRS